jgi:hypothetical protein
MFLQLHGLATDSSVSMKTFFSLVQLMEAEFKYFVFGA